MTRDAVSIGIAGLRKKCGVTISFLSDISGVSRTTLYALERGEKIRTSTVAQLLISMRRSRRCAPASIEIENLINQFAIDAKGLRSKNDVLDSLEEIVLDIGTLLDFPGKVDFERLKGLIRDLNSAAALIVQMD